MYIFLKVLLHPEGDPASTPPPATPPAGDPTPPSEPPAKTLTQEEATSLVAREAKKAQEALLRKLGLGDDIKSVQDGLKRYQEWQDKQKGDAEKSAEALAAAQKAAEQSAKRAEALEARFTAISAGATPQSAEDVVALASLQVADDVDMAAAIGKVLEKYPHFKGLPPDMDGAPNPPPRDTSITKEQFNKMSYSEMLELQQKNPALFKKLKG